MIAYDITRRSTFDSVIHWIKEVELYGAANVVLVLIGKYVCFRGDPIQHCRNTWAASASSVDCNNEVLRQFLRLGQTNS